MYDWVVWIIRSRIEFNQIVENRDHMYEPRRLRLKAQNVKTGRCTAEPLVLRSDEILSCIPIIFRKIHLYQLQGFLEEIQRKETYERIEGIFAGCSQMPIVR
ncbi:hypothetical protein CUU66_09935 [Peribacillus deserti]|uniref:Uncharacterized protein n=1 Tax=Peribacillus deserti TaxID=673318 RepID=A0A2N5M6R7_9BACI|nr:hypothetical protein CUU66_09935 [Peribacillus deserti]